MNDTIYRQAAIDALGKRPMVWTGSDYELGARNQYDVDVLALETVPPAQPEQKKGRWVKDDGPVIKGHCSGCGWNSIWQESDVVGMDYCPNCGAKMDGGDAE